MGKRSDFKRRDRDFYPTPHDAMFPLLFHIGLNMSFVEPCAGDGSLIRHLEKFGHKCKLASDIEPQADGIVTGDMFDLDFTNLNIITNPPWDRPILHRMIDKVIKQNAKAWLLFDADWWHTKQARPYKPFCEKVVSVGRVKWIEGSKSTGKDNCAWYLFVGQPVEYTKLF
jgi:hypothetical protein